jgi:hypothetical protein
MFGDRRSQITVGRVASVLVVLVLGAPFGGGSVFVAYGEVFALESEGDDSLLRADGVGEEHPDGVPAGRGFEDGIPRGGRLRQDLVHESPTGIGVAVENSKIVAVHRRIVTAPAATILDCPEQEF